MSVTLLVPTRGRPAAAAELAQAVHDADRAVAVAFIVDSDDPTRFEYLRTGLGIVLAGEPGCMNAALNGVAASMVDLGAPTVLGFMGDDHRPRTSGFGQLVLDAMADGARIVWGDDLVHGAQLPTAVFLHADVVRALGYFAPPDQRHLFLDNAWKAWADASGRGRYLPELVIEHLHPIAGKADWDEGYRRVNAGDIWEHDQAAFQAYTEDGRFAADVAKIAALS